jgi:ribosomal protein S18 acetylase RimI-like enzyme
VASVDAFSLRPVTPADRELLFAVYASTRIEELEPTGWTDAAKAAFLAQQFAAQDAHYHRHYPDASFDVIVVDGSDAGRLYVDRGGDEFLLVDIALLPAFRGRGVGGAALQAIVAEADAAGVPMIVHVEHSNRARSLYERHGFHEVDDQGIYVLYRRQPITAS